MPLAKFTLVFGREATKVLNKDQFLKLRSISLTNSKNFQQVVSALTEALIFFYRELRKILFRLFFPNIFHFLTLASSL